MPKSRRTDRGNSPDLGHILRDVTSLDKKVRARAVGALCPCRIGAENFEPHRALVRQAHKDASLVVRAAARHVLEEAMEHGDGLPTSRRMVTDEIARIRFRHRWRRETGDSVIKKDPAAGGRRRGGR